MKKVGRIMLTFLGLSFAGALVIALLILFFVLPTRVEQTLNKVRNRPPYKLSEETKALHSSLFVADLHADPLLWKRDLLKKSDYGHIDLPRLIEGNVGLLCFGVVTKTPKGQNFDSNPSNTDNITFLAVISGWPVRSWKSLVERAVYQARKLHKLSQNSGGKLTVIKTKQDLENLLAKRKNNEKIVGGLLSLEGVHALEGRLENLDRLYDEGFRMMGLTHFFDNEAAGSAHGEAKGGLTAFGRDLVSRMQEKGIAIDLAHASVDTIEDVLEISTAPIFVSHTGVRGTCDNGRNLSDDHLKRIAATGGIVGIAMFSTAVCGDTVDDTVQAMQYAVKLVGVDHVALGTDMDGAVTAPVDVTGLAMLTAALKKGKFSDDEIKKIMGGNAARVLGEILPN